MLLRFGLLLLVFAVGCKEKNPLYCEGHPDDTVNCPPPDAGRCRMDSDCGGLVCDTASMTCVQCTVDKAAACTGTSPVCSAEHTCQPCNAHAQCTASSVCLVDGSCADENQVAYVSATGTGADCTKASPCPLLKDAIARNLPYVKIAAPGAGKDSGATVVDGKAVTIVAEPGAKLDRDGDGAILEVRSANTDVKIVDLEITGASGAGIGNGIDVLPNGGAPKLTLVRARIADNQGLGVNVTAGSLTITQSTITNNQAGGISVTGTVSTFTITNNFIVRNGNSSTANVGGAALAGTSAGSTFAFNTVVDNQVLNTTLGAGGVLCDLAGFTAANNVIVRNFVNSDPTKTNANTIGQCSYPTSTIAMTVGGINFASPDNSPYNYHLVRGSSVIDQATTPTTITVDIDGDARPQGAQRDQGADEYKP